MLSRRESGGRAHGVRWWRGVPTALPTTATPSAAAAAAAAAAAKDDDPHANCNTVEANERAGERIWTCE